MTTTKRQLIRQEDIGTICRVLPFSLSGATHQNHLGIVTLFSIGFGVGESLMPDAEEILASRVKRRSYNIVRSATRLYFKSYLLPLHITLPNAGRISKGTYWKQDLPCLIHITGFDVDSRLV
mgnify:CR=1 FL=1